MAAPLDERIGEVLLGKYRVIGLLGRGGMGVVFEAEDLRLGRRVAIKVLGAAARTRGDAGPRFNLEARAIAALMHPHLVTLLDYDFLDDGTPAMVMERVDGMSLKALMSRRAFTPLEVVLVLYQTLLALGECHAKGVIHRDLKPENLLVTKGGPQGLHVKVIDFGLTKLLADNGATALTVNGQVFGSPRFMAPEQWLQKEVTARTDLYALGLIGICLVRGEHFITAASPFEICRAHLSQARPALRTTRDGTRVPPLLEQILLKAADPEPRVRFESAGAMLAALEPLTMDALNFTRFSGEQMAASVPTDEPLPAPFDAAAMAASIDASIASGELENLEMTQPALEGALELPAAEPAGLPVDPLATVLVQSALSFPEAAAAPVAEPEPEPVTNRARFAVPGGVFTAITRGDFERALDDAAQAAAERAASAPPPPAEPPAVLPEPVTRSRPAVAARVASGPPPGGEPPRPRGTQQLHVAATPGASQTWLVAGALLAVALGAGLALLAL